MQNTKKRKIKKINIKKEKQREGGRRVFFEGKLKENKKCLDCKTSFFMILKEEVKKIE